MQDGGDDQRQQRRAVAHHGQRVVRLGAAPEQRRRVGAGDAAPAGHVQAVQRRQRRVQAQRRQRRRQSRRRTEPRDLAPLTTW